MNDGGAVAHAIYRQHPKMLLSPAKPHECSRIGSRFTVWPNFDATVKPRRKFGVKF